MEEKEKKIHTKKLKGLIFVLAILVLLSVIALTYFYANDVTSIKKRNLNYINGTEWNEEVFPEGMPKFFRAYEGTLTAQNIGKSIYYVTTKAIPEYYAAIKDMDDASIKNYFTTNQKLIALDLGLENEEEFLNFANEIKKLNGSNFTIESFYIDGETIKEKTGKLKGDLYIKYEESDEIQLKIDVSKSLYSEKSSVKYYR